MSGGSPHAPATAIAVKECLDRVRPNTWRFDLTLQMPLFSPQDTYTHSTRTHSTRAQHSPTVLSAEAVARVAPSDHERARDRDRLRHRDRDIDRERHIEIQTRHGKEQERKREREKASKQASKQASE